MKKEQKILLIISIIIIVLGIIIGIGTSNEIMNSVSVDNSVNGATSGIGANYSDIIELFGVFGAKLIGAMIIVGSIIIDLFIWLVYGLILLSIKIIKKVQQNKN